MLFFFNCQSTDFSKDFGFFLIKLAIGMWVNIFHNLKNFSYRYKNLKKPFSYLELCMYRWIKSRRVNFKLTHSEINLKFGPADQSAVQPINNWSEAFGGKPFLSKFDLIDVFPVDVIDIFPVDVIDVFPVEFLTRIQIYVFLKRYSQKDLRCKLRSNQNKSLYESQSQMAEPNANKGKKVRSTLGSRESSGVLFLNQDFIRVWLCDSRLRLTQWFVLVGSLYITGVNISFKNQDFSPGSKNPSPSFFYFNKGISP